MNNGENRLELAARAFEAVVGFVGAVPLGQLFDLSVMSAQGGGEGVVLPLTYLVEPGVEAELDIAVRPGDDGEVEFSHAGAAHRLPYGYARAILDRLMSPPEAT